MKKAIIILYLAVCSLIISGCQQEFDKHFESQEGASANESIVSVLRRDTTLSLFVDAIDRLDFDRSLSKSGIFTCFAPTNEDTRKFLNDHGATSMDAIDEGLLIEWVNYHFIIGLYYKYDFNKQLRSVTDDLSISYFRKSIFPTRGEERYPSKFIRVFSSDFFLNRAEDYKKISGQEITGNTFAVNDVFISERYDIKTSNGVIHVLESPLNIAPRADIAIASDPELSIINSWLDNYIAYDLKGIDEATGIFDTTKIKKYTFGADIAKEANKYTFIAPTNEAMEKFFGPYMEENFDNNWDTIPMKIKDMVVKALFAPDHWGMSDITRGYKPPTYFKSVSNVYLRLANDVEPYYESSVASSNAIIYKVNTMPTPPLLNSVEGGIHLNPKRYSQWAKMLGKLSILTEHLLYAHPIRTLLVQPDSVWIKLVDDYTAAEKDSLGWSISTGIIDLEVYNGEFEYRYYSTSYGSILYKDGVFTDYLENEMKLLCKDEKFRGTNGAIYEVEGFLEPLSYRDTSKTVYKYRIRDRYNADSTMTYSLFNTALEITGLSELLNEVGSFTFTIFAPTDQAFKDAGLEDLNLITTEELTMILKRHIIQRKIFTDGVYKGQIVNLNNELFDISGAWDNFKVTTEGGVSLKFVNGEMNQQGNNGVLHAVSNLLK